MKVKVGDNVQVIAGKDRNKTGKIVKTLKKTNKVIVEGINVVKKHQKSNNTNEKGGIVELNAPIHVSNVKKVENTTKEKAVKEVKAKETKAPAAKTVKKTTKKATKA